MTFKYLENKDSYTSKGKSHHFSSYNLELMTTITQETYHEGIRNPPFNVTGLTGLENNKTGHLSVLLLASTWRTSDTPSDNVLFRNLDIQQRDLYPCNLISCWHQFLLQWPYESRDTENVTKSTKSNGTWTFEPTETLHTFPRGVCEKNESSLKCISTTISKILYRFLKSEAIDHEDKQHGQNMQSMVSRASWFIMAWTYALGQMYFTWGALISSKPALQPSLTGGKKS